MYLANDVIQNSKKKGPEYTREFGQVLKKAFQLLSNIKCSERTKTKLDRILNIWEERNVYDRKTVEDYKRTFHKKGKDDESLHFGGTYDTKGLVLANILCRNVTWEGKSILAILEETNILFQLE